MVAFEPDLRQVAKTAIFRDVLRREMAVVIDNRLAGRMARIQYPGGFTFE